MPIGGDWALVFDDHFDSGALDAAKWGARTTASDGSGTYMAANVSVSNSQLHLRVDANTDSASVTTGKIGGGPSPFIFSYGWAEARVRLPLQTAAEMTGAWHAFWLWADNASVSQGYGPQEVDFEMRGSFPNQIRVGHIWQTTPTKLSEGIDATFTPYDGQWHVYAYHWQPGQIDFYIDGEVVHTTTEQIPTSPLQILFDAKVGGWGGEPDGNTTFPYTMDVDYVRVWQKVNTSTLRWYQRVAYGGALDATQQTRYLTALLEAGVTTATAGIDTHARSLGTNDYLLEYCAPAALSTVEWANLLYRRLVLAESTVLANLTVTTYAGATWEARRQACKAALSL